MFANFFILASDEARHTVVTTLGSDVAAAYLKLISVIEVRWV